MAYDWLSSTKQQCACETNLAAINGAGLVDVLGAGIKYAATTKTSFRVEWLANGLLFPLAINYQGQAIAAQTMHGFMLGLNLHF